MKGWKITITIAVAIFIVLGIFVASAYSPMAIDVYKSPVSDQQHFSLTITGHLPGQSVKTFYFAITEYVSGVDMGGYGSGTNDSKIQTDLFGNFKINYPEEVTITDNNFSIGVRLVSESGIVIEKVINVPYWGIS